MIPKDYNQILFNILKPLLDQGVNLYLNTVSEDEDSQPLDFVVYRTGVVDTALVYGDGKCQLRECECDVIVNEYGTGNSENSGYLVKLVENQLIQNGISYKKYFPGVELKSNTTQTTFTFVLI